MRIVDGKTFIELPEGTIYCKGKKWYFDGIQIKGENQGTSMWWHLDPAWIEGRNSEEVFDRLEAMADKGESYPMQTSYSKGGPANLDDMFLVFEIEDLRFFRCMIDSAIALQSPKI